MVVYGKFHFTLLPTQTAGKLLSTMSYKSMVIFSSVETDLLIKLSLAEGDESKGGKRISVV